jgi:hypothetical protein
MLYGYSIAAVSFIEQYLEFSLSIHLHFVFWRKNQIPAANPIEINGANLCAIFERTQVTHNGNIDRLSFIYGDPQFLCPKILGGNHEHAMFVDDIEPRDCPEGSLARISSVVRLQCLDQCERLRVDKGFETSRSLFELGGDKVDGEVSLVAAVDGVSSQKRELANQMVKGRAQIVNDITDHQGPTNVSRAHVFEHYIKTLPIRILFEPMRMLFIFRGTPGPDSCVKLREVILRSRDFRTDTI